jgi:hypothetical protein
MAVSLADGLTIVNGVIAIAGVGSVVGVFKLVHKAGAMEEGRKRDITEIKGDIILIKQDLGNGAFHGIKHDLQTMQLTCAGNMGDIKARVTNLEEDMKCKIPNPFHPKPATE